MDIAYELADCVWVDRLPQLVVAFVEDSESLNERQPVIPVDRSHHFYRRTNPGSTRVE
jgi:hypothetical protein